MNIHDYLINTENRDWPKLLAAWFWLLPPKFTVWLVNRYGDIFLRLEDGSVHMLDVGGGELTRLADTREHFEELVDSDSNGNNWFMNSLVDQCVQAGLLLKSDQCYTYARPPILGGDYTVANTRVISLAEHFAFYGYLHEQLRNLPDGAQVKLEWVP